MAMNSAPVVSVVVATRERPMLAERALASIASQTFQDFETIVVDDGSTELARHSYRQICERYGERFRFHATVPPESLGSGPAAVRNRGIRAARGDYVAFLDDDDEWMKADHLETAVGALRRTGADFYFTDMIGVRDPKIFMPTWFPDRPERTGTPVPDVLGPLFRLPRATLVRIFRHHMIHPDCWVVERTTLMALDGFNERLRFVEDLELGMRIADVCKDIVYRAEPVVRYRLPEGDAESLKYDRLTVLLQYLLAAQTLRTTCRSPEVRRCARSREGWTLREIAGELMTRGRTGAALSFGWQSLLTFPTAGSLYSLGSLAITSMMRRAGQDVQRVGPTNQIGSA